MDKSHNDEFSSDGIESFRRLQNIYSESDVSRLFLKEVFKKISALTEVDVVIVGAGPAGLAAAYILSKNGLKTLIIERTLTIGGGILGGGMLLPLAVVEENEASQILRIANVKLMVLGEGLYYVNPVEAMLKLAVKALDEGVVIWPGVFVEDVITRVYNDEMRVKGVVINWTPIIEAKWHVDPLWINSKAVLDATGHDAYVVRLFSKRHPQLKLSIPGMSSMDIWTGEKEVVENTSMIVKGLYVAGMSVAESFNTRRMGPILGGMILSGKKAAELIINDLKSP